MDQVKCECGHVNPHGTIICESCGKVFSELESDKQLLDMRYEGTARRSQTYNKTFIDKIWNFFSSVKVGVWLIIITLIASSLGTILPQEEYIPSIMPAGEYYEDQYGWLGKLYFLLGFHNLYSSWWFLILIASIGISLVICSLDRVVPLYRALKKQRITRHESFLKRQRVYGITAADKHVDQSLQTISEKLKGKRYNIREESGNILAEKGRFSRWGPYVNHVGLIIFLIGGMLRFVPGMYIDKLLWLREGETKVIPETNEEYYLTNEKFILDFYDKDKDKIFEDALNNAGMVAKNYQSNVILYKKKGDSLPGEEPELEKVKEFQIRVNEPLKFDNYALYQSSYKLDELNKMMFSLVDKKSNKVFGDISIDLYDPQLKYDLGKGYSVEVKNYFPDFQFDENGEPATKSKIPNNPAFVFKMVTPENKEGEVSFVAIRQTIEPFGDNKYKMAFKGLETKNVTALTVRKDLTLWVLILGGIVFMVGVIQGSYWTHRRIWIRRVNGEVWVAAHTNKNWYGLKKEIQAVLSDTNINIPEDQLEKKKAE